MASYRRGPGPEAQYDPYEPGPYGYDEGYSDGPYEDWDPGYDDGFRPSSRRRRPAKQRGSMARSGAVLGVGVIAAVGAGSSISQAQSKPPVAISMPDMGPVSDVAGKVNDSLPDAESLPGVGDLMPSQEDEGPAPGTKTTTPFTQAGLSSEEVASGEANSGEALRARIMEQAEAQQAQADEKERVAMQASAAQKATEEAEAAKKKELAEKKKAAIEAKRKAEEEARRKAEAERLRKLAASYIVPVSNYTLTATFGETSSHWATTHTGQDFAAPTGTPIKALHSGTITESGWAGSYGYRTILTLDDGTEIWYCHQSSIIKTSGKVTTGDVIGRVGATGNVTGPHLHLEVRPGGGDPVDPMPWLRKNGVGI
ncbi:M23 family metallopeptidase [Streptomyces boninensis]|uniref:M23 family metallopeptidase n=1 Tax=Streptomyces boninensis TaxID=2039455 RepID=UPI003B21E707